MKDITFRLAPASREDALSMLDGIAAAEMLKGVRGSDPVNREALATLIAERVAAHLRLPRDLRDGSEPGVRDQERRDRRRRAHRASTGIRAPARFRPKHEDIVRDMNRIMKPDAVAVIGASGETGKIGNSVMKNLINGGYQGKIYPINPSADEIMGMQGVQEREGRARRRSTSRCSRFPRSSSPPRWSNAARRRSPARC